MFNLKLWLLYIFYIRILLKVKASCYFIFSGVSINFYKERPHPPDTKRDILFHFNPRPPNKLILNTCEAGYWQKEVVLIDDDYRETLFKKSFKLTIEPTDHGNEKERNFEFKISVNQKHLTWYLCLFDIKEATHLGYSPGLRIHKIYPNENFF